MFVNRFNELFERPPDQNGAISNVASAPGQPILPLISVQELYQAAAERAYRDHELDKLFNADYYGDHGSGI
ncbi:MAG: hypothetical protein WD738_15170 [Pirellulales bacterium]